MLDTSHPPARISANSEIIVDSLQGWSTKRQITALRPIFRAAQSIIFGETLKAITRRCAYGENGVRDREFEFGPHALAEAFIYADELRRECFIAAPDKRRGPAAARDLETRSALADIIRIGSGWKGIASCWWCYERESRAKHRFCAVLLPRYQQIEGELTNRADGYLRIVYSGCWTCDWLS